MKQLLTIISLLICSNIFSQGGFVTLKVSHPIDGLSCSGYIGDTLLLNSDSSIHFIKFAGEMYIIDINPITHKPTIHQQPNTFVSTQLPAGPGTSVTIYPDFNNMRRKDQEIKHLSGTYKIGDQRPFITGKSIAGMEVDKNIIISGTSDKNIISSRNIFGNTSNKDTLSFGGILFIDSAIIRPKKKEMDAFTYRPTPIAKDGILPNLSLDDVKTIISLSDRVQIKNGKVKVIIQEFGLIIENREQLLALKKAYPNLIIPTKIKNKIMATLGVDRWAFLKCTQ